MKVLIWILCITIATILNALLGYATGIKVGYLVFYFVVYFVAKKLCDKWDERDEEKRKVEYENYRRHRDSLWVCERCGASNYEEDLCCKRCRNPRKMSQESDEIAQLEIIRPKAVKKENSQSTEQQDCS
ncbi:MAG: hypothetical protein IJC10_03240 [Clostridia bacterium]|nr:hypothetical protein [Clostridia bacterium]